MKEFDLVVDFVEYAGFVGDLRDFFVVDFRKIFWKKNKIKKIVAKKIFLFYYFDTGKRDRSSVWLECLPVTQKVASSSLVGPAI